MMQAKLERAKKLTKKAQSALNEIDRILIKCSNTSFEISSVEPKVKPVKTGTPLTFNKPKPKSPKPKPIPLLKNYEVKHVSPLQNSEPQMTDREYQPITSPLPEEPDKNSSKYEPNISLVDSLLPGTVRKKRQEAKCLFEKDYREWRRKVEKLKLANNKAKEKATDKFRRDHKDWSEALNAAKQKAREPYEFAYEKWANAKEEAQLKYNHALDRWRDERDQFKQQEKEKANTIRNIQKEHKKGIRKIETGYRKLEPKAVAQYAKLIIDTTPLCPIFRKKVSTEYLSPNKTLVVEYLLPSRDRIPKTKEVRYIKTRDEFEEKKLSDSAINKIYDRLIYSILLALMCRLFKATDKSIMDSIVINGLVEFIDGAIGRKKRICIASIHARRNEFEAINLKQVNPKECFKNLKGVGSSKLHSLSAIPPIISLDKKDKRFVNAYGVADKLSEAVNIAAIDWQDFEHLVREIFEKEFSIGGGEVKITRASRDYGVDAIAFDPDPIRGGKIVIQAKRYTNVVGVAAVRDLYGTVINEGAMKGILITTSEYGPDAYKFAKGKPLTLMNGSNLLFLLQKHGYKAKIDLKEAKVILKEREIRE